MKRIILGLWLMVGLGAFGQTRSDSVRKVIDSSIVLLRTYALHRDRPDWDHVRERAYELAGQTSRWEDLGPAIAWLFEAVGDHHGWLSVKDTMFRWERPEPPFLSEALKEEFAKGNRIVRKLLPGGIGYLRVPGMVLDTSEYNQYAQRLKDSLCALEVEGARRFIIDLRLNAEGAMSPVIAGLAPLLGDGSPVAILTGHGTGSAGACVAVAFKGRKRTWFIGEPTASGATGNVRHPVVAGQVDIVIAETLMADRDHRCYPRNLIPDEWVPGGDDFVDPGRDKKIRAASYRLQAVRD